MSGPATEVVLLTFVWVLLEWCGSGGGVERGRHGVRPVCARRAKMIGPPRVFDSDFDPLDGCDHPHELAGQRSCWSAPEWIACWFTSFRRSDASERGELRNTLHRVPTRTARLRRRALAAVVSIVPAAGARALAVGSPHSDAPTRPNEVNHHNTCNPRSMRHSEIGRVAAA